MMGKTKVPKMAEELVNYLVAVRVVTKG